jgi:chemosensory pili system protein ChpA (sensor histidine kinase/response regulator)
VAHDVLFFCALAKPPAPDATPTLHAVRTAWAIGHERLDVYQEPVFGLYDPEALAQAQRRIAAIKNAWSALAGGDAAHLDGVLGQLSALIDAMKALLPPGEPLMAELDAVRQKIAQSRQPPGPELAMETAAALLFLEASTAEFRPRDVRFTERLKRLAERLAKVRHGARVPQFEPWMEQLYRQLNDREAMGTVVDELRVGLAQTEQYLDRFFREPGTTAPLDPVPGWLSEMHGVLSVLGMDQAALAVSRMRAQVSELKNSDGRPSGAALTALFQKFGNNFGTLGFLIDTLNYQPVLARKLFAYDDARGELTYVPGRTPAEAVPETVAPVASGESIGPAADQAEPHPAWAPGGAAQTAEATHALEAGGVDQPSSGVDRTETARSVPPRAEGASVFDDDRTLIDIFLGEARDMIATGQQALDALAKEPADHDQLMRLRRGFHTLKGSSGMLGLAEFGTAARSFEDLLNDALAQEKPLDQSARAGVAGALAAMARWASDLDGGHDDAWRAAPFETLANTLQRGGEPSAVDLEPTAAARAPQDDPVANLQVYVASDGAPAAAAAPQPIRALPDLPLLPNLDLPPTGAPDGVFTTWGEEQSGAPMAHDGSAPRPDQSEPARLPAEAAATDAQSADTEIPPDAAGVGAVLAAAAPAASLHIGALEISEPLYSSFLKEADDWSEQLETRLSGWARGVHAEVPEGTSYYAHSLAGSSATVGLSDLAALARAVETALVSVNDRTRDMARGASV